MGLETAALLTAIGTATAVGGTAYSVYNGQRAAAASKEAENLRQKQLNLDSAMKRREMIRKIQLSESTAVARATSSGTQDSSSFGGSIGSIQSRGGEDLNYNKESTDIGNNLFAANRDVTTFQSLSQAGSGVSSLGTSLLQSTGTLTRIGTDLFAGRGSPEEVMSRSDMSNIPIAPYRGPSISTIY